MTAAMHQRASWLTKHILVHEPELRSWLGRRHIPGIDIDDVIQESYAILAGLQSVEHIYRPRIYFFEVAKSVVFQYLRRSKIVAFSALAEFDALFIPDDKPSPEAIAAGRHELARLAQMIDKLPPKCRMAFTLRKVSGYSQKEVAAMMGVSENTVEKHIGKAYSVLGCAIGRDIDRGSVPSLNQPPVKAGEAHWTVRS